MTFEIPRPPQKPIPSVSEILSAPPRPPVNAQDRPRYERELSVFLAIKKMMDEAAESKAAWEREMNPALRSAYAKKYNVMRVREHQLRNGGIKPIALTKDGWPIFEDVQAMVVKLKPSNAASKNRKQPDHPVRHRLNGDGRQNKAAEAVDDVDAGRSKNPLEIGCEVEQDSHHESDQNS